MRSRLGRNTTLPWESEETERQIDEATSTVSFDSSLQKAYTEARLQEYAESSDSVSTMKLEEQAETYRTGYDWQSLKVRDEVVAQTVSCWLDGIFETPETDFEQEFQEERFELKEKHYNKSISYSENAGSEIVDELKDIKAIYQELEGSPGEKFRRIYSNRDEYLQEGEWVIAS
jgi:hypothetical protein